MTDKSKQADEPFDLVKIQQLVELMEKHGLSEIFLRKGSEQWKLRRGPAEVVGIPGGYAMPQPMPVPMAAPAPAASGSGQPAAPAAESPSDEMLIKSPTVGTFYSSPNPEDPPFVKVGSKVTPETQVCIVEAMKVFNAIPAEVSGTITAVLVNNGDSVEFGQPLFRVKAG